MVYIVKRILKKIANIKKALVLCFIFLYYVADLDKVLNLIYRENKMKKITDYLNKKGDICIDISSIFHSSGKQVFELKVKKSLYKYQVRKNICSFKVDKTIKKWTGSFANYKGAIFVFPSQLSKDILENSEVIKDSFLRVLEEDKGRIIYKPNATGFKDLPFEHNFFGKYIVNDSISFDENSVSVEINGIPDDIIFELCDNVFIKSFIVKNLNTRKIYFCHKSK